MTADPKESPVTTPDELTVATEVLLLVHTPPEVASVNVLVLPKHEVAEPEIAATVPEVLTVTVNVDAVVPQVVILV